MRTAVAFGAAAIITTSRHSPGDSAVLAKAASGALEHIHQIEVQNLAKAIDQLHQIGFTTIGLDSEAAETIEDGFNPEGWPSCLAQKARDCARKPGKPSAAWSALKCRARSNR